MQAFDYLPVSQSTKDSVIKNTWIDFKLNMFFALTYGLGVSILIDPISDLVLTGKLVFNSKIFIPMGIVFCMYLITQPKDRWTVKVIGSIADVLNIVGYTCLLPSVTVLIHAIYTPVTSQMSLSGSILGILGALCVFYVKNSVLERLRI